MKEEILKTYPQENKIKKSNSSLIGSSLLILATILPCLDRILCWIWPSLDINLDSRGTIISVNIWQGCLYTSAVLIAVAAFFKPNMKIYYFPIVINAYSAIVYFAPIFGYNVKFLALNSWLAAIISLATTIPIMWMLQYIKALTIVEDNNSIFYQDVKDEFEKLNLENNTLKNKLKSLDKHHDNS